MPLRALPVNAHFQKKGVSQDVKAPRLHSHSEASRLVLDAALHSWLQKRQCRNQDAVPRTFMSRFRHDALRRCFESIDRDGSGSIEMSELVFALKQLGLNADHATELVEFILIQC